MKQDGGIDLDLTLDFWIFLKQNLCFENNKNKDAKIQKFGREKVFWIQKAIKRIQKLPHSRIFSIAFSHFYDNTIQLTKEHDLYKGNAVLRPWILIFMKFCTFGWPKLTKLTTIRPWKIEKSAFLEFRHSPNLISWNGHFFSQCTFLKNWFH